MSNQSDARLIERLKRGDQDAWAELFEQSYPKLYSYVLFRVNDPHLAEDLVSDTFVRLTRNISKFKDQGKPVLAWLYTVAGNIIRDHWRKTKGIQLSNIDDVRGLVSGDDPTEPLDFSMMSDRLSAAILKLTEDQINVIFHKFVDGLSNREVADIMGKEEGSIKSLQHRALRSLKRHLDGDDFDDLGWSADDE